jgi:hypothetical protein
VILKVQDTKALYAELKPAMEAIATPLFDFSKQCLRDRGNFLPHAAVLTGEGKIALVGTMTEQDLTNAKEVLPLLQGSLRILIKEKGHSAVGIAENVNITIPGQSATDAIKVLFEHRRGLTVALYMPFSKKFLRSYVFGGMISMLASPEVNAWTPSVAT